MASLVSTGSPKQGKKSSSPFNILDQSDGPELGIAADLAALKPIKPVSSNTPSPLLSSKLGNMPGKTEDSGKKLKLNHPETSKAQDSSRMDDILARLRANDSPQSGLSQNEPSNSKAESKSMEKLLATLNGQNQALKKQQMDLKEESGSDALKDEDPSSGSDLFTPVTESFDVTSTGNGEAEAVQGDAVDILRIKKELAAAKSVITRQEQELAETRNLKHTMDQAMGPPSEADYSHRTDITEQTISHLQNAFNASARPFAAARNDSWHPQEDTRSDNSDGLSSSGYNRSRGIWNNQPRQSFGGGFNATVAQPPVFGDLRTAQGQDRAFNTAYDNSTLPAHAGFPANQRVFSGPSPTSFAFDGRYGTDLNHYTQPNMGIRRAMSQYNRGGAAFSNRGAPFGNYSASLGGLTPSSIAPLSIPSPLGYQPRPIGSPLSPTASEFTTGSLPNLGSPWSPITAANGQTYVTPLEPMNYRRLLDKTVSCDWKYIVDKIVCSNDQQASIFLQQKLKVGTAEQKFEIVEAIVNQAYPLMINRFGNFLVQRCFEHGTPEQVVAIANAIHGNVLSLSMDAFGCHVIQKAFDSVPEQHKADMVRELLRRIPDTVIHRYACHVWQKLFELRWSGEPPQIMLKVNEALRGMWHEVALGETGSLVVQNIFENCVEEEKRPAIEEVIASIDLIAHGQFGNWCIQHICEHGSPQDKRRVVDHILSKAYNYSIDQFASKVVEKCLKIGGVEFLDRYLGVITTAHPDRPRIPLIDIAGDQYGNYLIQWILMNTHHHQREQVAIHIRKHMVSLRGSKFGSRVAMLCCNPASITRPGPGVIVNPFGAPGQPRGWGRYR